MRTRGGDGGTAQALRRPPRRSTASTSRCRQGTVCGLLGPNGAGKTTAVRILAHAAAARRRARRRSRASTSRARPRRCAARIGLTEPARRGRRGAHRPPEPRDVRPPVPPRRRARPGAARTSCSSSSASPRRPTARPSTTRAACAAGSTSRPASSCAPQVLFLDEPTTGQDPRNRNEVWDVVRGLVADGTTVLLTTHYLDEADQLADRISVIDRGRVIADGTPDAAQGADRRQPDRRRRARRAHELPAAAALRRARRRRRAGGRPPTAAASARRCATGGRAQRRCSRALEAAGHRGRGRRAAAPDARRGVPPADGPPPPTPEERGGMSLRWALARRLGDHAARPHCTGSTEPSRIVVGGRSSRSSSSCCSATCSAAG